MSVRQQLVVGLSSLKLDLPTIVSEQLLVYLALLNKWNRVYQLTGLKSESAMLHQLILDSLSLLSIWPEIEKQQKGDFKQLADVGSGAGLPGIPLAIVMAETMPEKQWTLIDSNNKKTSFMQQVKIELGLTNIVVKQTRVENWHPEVGFDGVISKAFSSLHKFIQLTGHLIKPKGCLLAMKGPTATNPDHYITEELKTAWQIKARLLHPVIQQNTESSQGNETYRQLLVIRKLENSNIRNNTAT